MNELNDLLKSLPNYALLTTEMKNSALAGSRIPDSEGRWPGDTGYVNTHDVYYAAILLIPFLKAQQVVTSAGSEGTTISATPPDWDSLLAFYRSLSPIINSSGNDVLQIVPIPGGPHVVPTNMRSGGSYYGDVNTTV